jgi:predicted nucleotidyltransferase
MSAVPATSTTGTDNRQKAIIDRVTDAELSESEEWTVVTKKPKERKEPNLDTLTRDKVYLLEDLIKIIKEHFAPYKPFCILLYGSYALNKANKDSDVDIAVMWNKLIPRNIYEIKRSLVEKLGKHVDFVNFIFCGKMVNEQNDNNINFLNNMYSDSIEIVNQKHCIWLSRLIGKLHMPK